MPAVRMPAFLTAPDEAVMAEPWRIVRGEVDAALGDDLPSFDPAATIELRRRIAFDPAAVAIACGLGAPERVAAVALWSSRLTGLKGASSAAVGAGTGPQTVDLILTLAGGDLGGALVLRTVLVLADELGTPGPLVAHVPGSVLWEGEPPLVVDLEGTGTRFPTELRRFGDGNGFPPRAAWYLDWDREDLNLPVLGSVRLYLNDAHPMMAGLAAGATDAETARIRETLRFDIARDLVSGALANREFLNDPGGFGAGSVGATVRRLCTRVLFPYDTLDEVAHRARTAPSRFAADLQAALGLYWDAAE